MIVYNARSPRQHAPAPKPAEPEAPAPAERATRPPGRSANPALAARDALLRELWLAYVPADEIARRLGFKNAKTALVMAWRLGLPRRYARGGAARPILAREDCGLPGESCSELAPPAPPADGERATGFVSSVVILSEWRST